MKHVLILAAVVFGCLQGQESPIIVTPGDVKWNDAPPSLPPGAKATILAGDPGKEGPFTLRLKMPADYKIGPHFHPDTETVTVLSGSFNVSMGESFDASKAKHLEAGSFVAVPKKSAHFAFTKEETVIQVNAHGPWSITYVNSADDPRNKK